MVQSIRYVHKVAYSYVRSAANSSPPHNKSRAIAAVSGDPERHRFLLGSSTVRESNEVSTVSWDPS